MIPKIIHQIYWNFKVKNGKMFDTWKKLSDDCKQMYTQEGWEYRLWGKQDADNFIYQNFPWLRKKWFFSTNIEKVDILRYAIMYIHGGMYIDMDTKCLKPYNPPQHANIILGGTALAKTLFINRFYSINNNIMLSIPNHPFWQSILHRINIYKISDMWPSFIRISMHTGPYCLQNVYENYPNKADIIVHNELSVVKTIDKDTYFLHDSTKSWVSISDSIHLGIFLLLLPLIIRPRLLNYNYMIISIILILLLIFLLNSKKLKIT